MLSLNFSNLRDVFFGSSTFEKFQQRVRRAFAAVLDMKASTKRKTFSWMQFTGGISILFYTKENLSYAFLCFVCSATAIKGFNDFVAIQKSDFPFQFVLNRKWSKLDFASGMFTFCTGVLAFSEFYGEEKLMCIPCLALILSGYYYTTSTIKSLDNFLDERPILKCFQLMFEPALSACATAYVFYYRELSGGRLKLLPIIVTAAFGFRLAKRGCVKSGYKNDRKLLLLKRTEMVVGGCLVCISCATLAAYSAARDCFWTSAFLSFWSSFGIFVTFGSFSCFQKLLEVDCNLFLSMVGMTVGPLAFKSGWLMIAFLEESTEMHLAFMFLITAGPAILVSSLHRLYRSVSRQIFYACCERVFGSLVAVDSSIVSVYVAYKMGRSYSLWTVPFVLAGICTAYSGFRKEIRTSAW